MHAYLATFTLVALVLARPSAGVKALDARAVNAVCDELASSLSSESAVFWPDGPQADKYWQDIGHYATSSTQHAACSVEPGTTYDLGRILQILGQTRTPFAVKGGGHAMNPTFSSTRGIQIAMSRFNEVTFHPDTNTATVGAGLIWDDVYAALEPYSVGVVGGRVTGIGVAGFTLGGGYSWKTNQFGLALDNVDGFELVLPSGRNISVTRDNHPDLFFGLKGGYNNFGIVTRFTLRTHPQTDVWGGVLTVDGDEIEAVKNATVKFSQNVVDPKASVLPTEGYTNDQGGLLASILMFYDGPSPPEGIFDDFLSIPFLSKDLKTRSLLDLIRASPSNSTAGIRGIYQTVSLLSYTPSLMDAITNETTFWGKQLSSTSVFLVTYAIEPFLSSIFSHAPASSSAYPPDRTRGLSPLNLYIAYTRAEDDKVVWDAARQSAERLTQVAVDEGQDVADAALYPNYAIFSTPLERMYGRNVEILRALKARYDPGNVMGLAGGWKF